MTPAQRHALLFQHGLPVPSRLPRREAEPTVKLRCADELWRRLLALWGVVGTAILRENDFFKDYFSVGERRGWLSVDEAAFLFDDDPPEPDLLRFSWRMEALVFLAWCAGLGDELELPDRESSADAFLHLFPDELEDASKLRQAIRVRPAHEILGWAERLRRLPPNPAPSGALPEAVKEWRHAATWMIRGDDADDWDRAGTDT